MIKFFSKVVLVSTQKAFDFVEITKKIEQVVIESKVKNGFALLRSPHNTGTIICNEDDPSVLKDIKASLKRFFPKDITWEHNYESLDNARAHQIVTILGHTHWVPIENNRLKLGTWQKIFFLELFEGRQRRVEIIVVGN